MFRCNFEDDSFELFDKTAGYYISHQVVEPKTVQIYEDLIERLIQKGIELRFTTNLHPLREAILPSGLEGFGMKVACRGTRT